MIRFAYPNDDEDRQWNGIGGQAQQGGRASGARVSPAGARNIVDVDEIYMTRRRQARSRFERLPCGAETKPWRVACTFGHALPQYVQTICAGRDFAFETLSHYGIEKLLGQRRRQFHPGQSVVTAPPVEP